MQKHADAFRTISEVAEDLDLPQHVLRFWEMRFPQIKPLKRSGGRRYYRPEDVELLRGVKRLLYGEGYTIKGVQRILKQQGARSVAGLAHGPVPQPEPEREAEIETAPAERRSLEVADGAPLAPRGQAPGSLSARQIRILEGAVVELEECRRILAAARG